MVLPRMSSCSGCYVNLSDSLVICSYFHCFNNTLLTVSSRCVSGWVLAPKNEILAIAWFILKVADTDDVKVMLELVIALNI